MQFEFLWRDEDALRTELEHATGLRVNLTVTDNTSTMMTVKRDRASGEMLVRVHRMFLGAGQPVIRALARWVQHPRAPRSTELLNDFIREHRHLISPRDGAALRVETAGTHYDLEMLYREENAAHFAGSVTARITWGRMPTQRPRRSIRFGSYSTEERLIRIHPCLDQPFVPEFFVRFIVFHEMLHAFLGVKEGPSGRRQMHTTEFRTREKAHPGYEGSIAWLNESRNLNKLLNAQTRSR